MSFTREYIMKVLRSLAALLFALVLVAPVLLQAHMKLEKSVPAEGATLTSPPSMVQLFFSEAPDMAVSKLEIHGGTSKATLVGTHVMDKSLMATVKGDLPDGAYVVQWQGAGDDGHLQKGELKFTLKRK
jgi:methionine-rich copper-binding protein CopC